LIPSSSKTFSLQPENLLAKPLRIFSSSSILFLRRVSIEASLDTLSSSLKARSISRRWITVTMIVRLNDLPLKGR